MILISLSTGVCIFLLVALIGFLQKVWWTPIRIQNIMRSQGIKGPAYRFLHGNTKEIIQMREESISNAMDFSSHDVFPRIMPHIHAWKKLYGKNYLIWHGLQAQLVVTEPELIKEILNNKDGKYLKGKLDVISKKLIGDGIILTEGEKWSKLRKIANHAFYAESLKGMIPAMIVSVETMLERWRQNEENEIDVYKESRLLASEVISRTAFGSSYLKGKNIFDMLTKLGMIAARNDFRIRFPGMEKFFKLHDDLESDKIEQAIRESIIGMIDKRAEKMQRGEENNYGSDFLGSLIKANHDPDEKNRISIDDMVDECKTFYLAGQETTNGLLAWSIFLLAIHKDWQEKARNEVIELFGHENPNPEGIARLKAMTMILNETLRLYSPVINLLRRVEREVKLGKLIIPANTEFYLPLLALHHDPEIWGQDVHIFKPERFAEGVARATSNNITGFIPFGFGPRMCVGLNFAVNEAKIALSMILQRYQFTLSPNYVHDPIQILIVRPQKGVQIVLTLIRLLHKEIIHMREESIINAMDFSSHDVFQRIMPHIHAWKHLHGKNYLIWHGPQAQLVVTEPELINEILNNRDGTYIKGKVDVFSKKLLGDGIVLSEGKRWSKLRKIANHAFYAESLKFQRRPCVYVGDDSSNDSKCGNNARKMEANEEKEIDVYKEFRLLKVEVISRIAFGSSYLEGESISDMLTKSGMIAARNSFRIHFPGIE
ncbi:hypothetical protein RHSIM_Rhsim12G0072200 [Rhododendron simsii]|uniref:Cytochrome P450 n=1 Tax=Rhododendron simsii TaxID=118357 RepID=A0A834G8X1_RHOSS|nr:hypothetical protein RHSIM_Rhsim12G0072200 [Rhododendron simsii]